jgi:hypothetical protein
MKDPTQAVYLSWALTRIFAFVAPDILFPCIEKIFSARVME